MKPRGKLTQKLEILKFIEKFRLDHSYGPTFREVLEGAHFSTTSMVDYYIRIMCNEGLILYEPGTARSLSLLPAGEQLARKYFPSPKPRKSKTATYVNLSASFRLDQTPSLIGVPLLGITFGGPTQMTFSEVSPDNQLSVCKEALPGGIKPDEVFALQVKGVSMINAGINDGDYILLRRTEQASTGEMVVVWLDDENETTLKYFYPEKEGIRLEPANDDFQPIHIDSERAKHLRVVGKVVQVVRGMEED